MIYCICGPGIILSSPGNPTGAMLSPQELREMCEVCDRHGVVFLSDEIYHGITYGKDKQATALEFSDNAVVINSFSKYFSMTGWRLGWMVVPTALVGERCWLNSHWVITFHDMRGRYDDEAHGEHVHLRAHTVAAGCLRCL